MLGWLIFMAAQIDNTDAIQDTPGGRLPKTDVTADVTSPSGSSLASSAQHPATRKPTLGGRASSALIDGHARPSIFAVTPGASTNVEKLMDTLRRASSAPINVTSRCYVPRFERAGWSPSLLRAVTCSLVTAVFIDTHDEENSMLTSTESTRSQNFHRYTFDMLRTHKGGPNRN